ncbi:MAG: hypothetical protein ACHP65_07030 [Legionellales bacterium]
MMPRNLTTELQQALNQFPLNIETVHEIFQAAVADPSLPFDAKVTGNSGDNILQLATWTHVVDNNKHLLDTRTRVHLDVEDVCFIIHLCSQRIGKDYQLVDFQILTDLIYPCDSYDGGIWERPISFHYSTTEILRALFIAGVDTTKLPIVEDSFSRRGCTIFLQMAIDTGRLPKNKDFQDKGRSRQRYQYQRYLNESENTIQLKRLLAGAIFNYRDLDLNSIKALIRKPDTDIKVRGNCGLNLLECIIHTVTCTDQDIIEIIQLLQIPQKARAGLPQDFLYTSDEDFSRAMRLYHKTRGIIKWDPEVFRAFIAAGASVLTEIYEYKSFFEIYTDSSVIARAVFALIAIDETGKLTSRLTVSEKLALKFPDLFGEALRPWFNPTGKELLDRLWQRLMFRPKNQQEKQDADTLHGDEVFFSNDKAIKKRLVDHIMTLELGLKNLVLNMSLSKDKNVFSEFFKSKHLYLDFLPVADDNAGYRKQFKLLLVDANLKKTQPPIPAVRSDRKDPRHAKSSDLPSAPITAAGADNDRERRLDGQLLRNRSRMFFSFKNSSSVYSAASAAAAAFQ